jgi:hypothetical protein
MAMSFFKVQRRDALAAVGKEVSFSQAVDRQWYTQPEGRVLSVY